MDMILTRNVNTIGDVRKDLTESEHEIQFDLNNNKRIIIHGGIVVVEEN